MRISDWSSDVCSSDLLAEAGFAVASGMARGIDTAAHLGALPRPTIAVLGGGADVIYPPENAALHAEIRRDGPGIAALPLGVTPPARHLPRRHQTGSASGRDRVCPELWLSVVAGTLN